MLDDPGTNSRPPESYLMIMSHHINEDWPLISHVSQTRATHELLKGAVEE